MDNENKTVVKLTTPQDMALDDELYNILLLDLISKLEHELNNQTKGLVSYKLNVTGNYPYEILNEVVNKYISAGWAKVDFFDNINSVTFKFKTHNKITMIYPHSLKGM